VVDKIATWIHEEWPEETRASGQCGAAAVADRFWATTFRTSEKSAVGEASLPITLAAVIRGDVVGTVSLYAEDMAGRDADFGPWLAALYVDSACRGCGVAAALLTAAAGMAKRMALSRLSLWFPKSKAHLLKLYQKFGWVVVDEVHYQCSSFGGHVIIMSLPLV
jgi:GNAT superfamily N-acetyltransferase